MAAENDDNWTLKKLFGADAEAKSSDPEFMEYLHELGSYSAEKLANSPRELSYEKLSLQEETENLAFKNYKTFIQAANCSKEIYDDFTLVENHLETVVSRLPILSEKCRDFLQEAQKIGDRRQTDSLALNKHAQILEVLEMPQVMDTCVRAGYYDEALELAQYVTKLQRRTAHIPIIQNVAKEVLVQREVLLDQLLDQLHSQLNLSKCLRIVGYLRRLGIYTESELRFLFLTARDSWFGSLIKTVPDTDPYQHITKVIEASRNNLFDIIAHYKAAFSDDEMSIVHNQQLMSQIFLAAPQRRETLPSHLPAILHTWIYGKIRDFLETLKTDLKRGVGNRLDSVLSQCMYFGLSFGRVGADFRSLICSIFEETVFADFSMTVDQATAKLLDELSGDFVTNIRPGSHKTLGYSVSSSSGPVADEPVLDLCPPMCLLDFNPLAVYCNGILNAFNAARLCLPMTLAPKIIELLQSSLLLAVNQLANIAEHGFDQMNESNQEKFRCLCGLFVVDLAPYLNRCLEALFPVTAIASIMGIGVGQALEIEGIRIDVDAIREPISYFVPYQPLILSEVEKLLKETDKIKEFDHKIEEIDDDKNGQINDKNEEINEKIEDICDDKNGQINDKIEEINEKIEDICDDKNGQINDKIEESNEKIEDICDDKNWQITDKIEEINDKIEYICDGEQGEREKIAVKFEVSDSAYINGDQLASKSGEE